MVQMAAGSPMARPAVPLPCVWMRTTIMIYGCSTKNRFAYLQLMRGVLSLNGLCPSSAMPL